MFRVCSSSSTGASLPRRVSALALLILACLVLLACLAPSPTLAQPTSSVDAPPAYVRVADGDVMLDRGTDSTPADSGMPVATGERLRTQRARAQLFFPDGTIADIDEFSTLDVHSASALRLIAGRLHLTVPSEATTRWTIETIAATVQVDDSGDYRVAILGNSADAQTELAVVRGRAELRTDRGSVRLFSGERSAAWERDLPTRPERLDAVRRDPFDDWSAAHQPDRSGGPSVQYLPPDLRPYGGTLDRDGAWTNDVTYGYVWYPAVDAVWQPYSSGYWTIVPRYGWTWIGLERWAWPTHHFGRWGYARSRWFWIPERRWAPAWVSWGAAPGYVSWSPLGFNNRPVFDLTVSFSARRRGGWTVVPRDRFGIRGEPAHRVAMAPGALPLRTPFVLQNAPPIPAPRSAPRRIVGATPVPGIGSPRATPRPVPDGPGPDGRPSGPPPAVRHNDAGAVPRAGSAAGRRALDAGRRAPRVYDTNPAQGATATTPSPETPPAATPAPWQAVPRYPFGDFRRRAAPVEPAAAEPTPPWQQPNRGMPRSGNARPDRTPVRPSSPATPPNETHIVMPPAEPAPFTGTRGSRSEPSGGANSGANSGGSFGRTRREGDGSRGGAGTSGAPQSGASQSESPQSGASPRGGSSAGQAQPRGDGRAHDPNSRRPR